MSIDLAGRLRRDTHAAHQRLEDALGLLDGGLKALRFRRALENFYGFHLVWEPSVLASGRLAPVFVGRSRLTHLRRDLLALGLTPADIAGLPRCAEASRLAAGDAGALGSLYVMEGSTLGGQLIFRATAGAAWVPPGGLTYFNPYGEAVGRKWRALREVLDAACEADHDAVVEGALATFSTLTAWMSRGAGARGRSQAVGRVDA